MASENGRVQALDRTLSDITKRFGDGAIMRLGEATHLSVEVIPTGSLAIDLAYHADNLGPSELPNTKAHRWLLCWLPLLTCRVLD